MADTENTTGKPVENTPSQTLFRFVSLRSPQLSNDKDQDKRFILFPDKLKNDNAFYKPVTTGTGSKIKLLKQQASIYLQNVNRIKNANDLKIEHPEFHEFSTWLARNKSTITKDELISRKLKMFGPGSTLISIPDPIVLWNNLIYQVITQADFYIKEAVMQLLFALHIYENPNTTEEQAKALLGARVVLPKELMLDETTLAASQSVSKKVSKEPKVTYPTEEMQKQQEISIAKTKLSRIETLKKNLSVTEKQYTKEYQTSYQSQQETYQREIAPILEKYNAEVADARAKYCEVRPLDQEYDPKDPCRQPKEVPYPKVQKFEFSFRDEVSARTLVASLKEENIETLLDILGYQFNPEKLNQRNTENDLTNIENLLEGRNTFAELTSVIIKNTEKLNDTIIANTESNNEIYTSIGGVMMPLARTVAVPFTYQICPKTIYKLYNLNLALNVPDSTWDVSGVSYALIFDNNNSVNSYYFVKSRTGNTIYLNDLLEQGVEYSVIQDSAFDIKVYFTNGRVAQFRTNGINVRTCVSGAFELEVEEGEPPVTIDDENHFIPSGFGFKNIGVADYLKVEQSTHAYVEGEVAHIENVMAREYREKSTRRLRRSENTTTSSSDTEREQINDTTTANRFEMQAEISKMMQEGSENSTQFGVNVDYKSGFGLSVNSSLGLSSSHHSSKEESTRQAMTQSQDITSRAMDRIVNKVHEERIEKIIEEFEENNSHGLDNRKGDKHVVGVYRWVDKLMKNQIYNYGKRMMFEFMVPEPAKLHILGMKDIKSVNQTSLVKPEDPRISTAMLMKDFSFLENDVILKYWISKYNVEIEIPLKNMVLSKSYSETNIGENEHYNKTESVTIPEGYIATHAYANGHFKYDGDGRQYHSYGVAVGQHIHCISERRYDGSFGNIYFDLDNVSKAINISYHATNYHAMSIGVNIYCTLSTEAKKTWLQKTFNAIINAYEEALIEYNNKVSEEQNKAVVIKDSNPNFYRQIENTVLRKNCISYMADRAVGSTHGYGLAGLTEGSVFNDYETVLSSKLDKYTAFVKFMEQAFEWENLSYYLYPYYWGNKQNWTDLYQAENTDPLFRAFLQSGMARVVATVRPGFEDVVQFYLATGKIWNGGEVPVIGDDLYLSIVDEMKEPKGIKQGKAWLTRLPTTLNILQAESIGLKVAHALPFSTENPDDFEVPSEVITKDKFNFETNDHLLGGGSGEKWIQLTWQDIDQYNFITIDSLDAIGQFPRIYELGNRSITIDRDATWKKTDSILKFYDALADEISKTDGIEAYPSARNGILMKIDINKNKHFKLSKPNISNDDDVLEFTTDGTSSIKFTNGLTMYSLERLLDKNGNQLTSNDFTDKAPLSKFLL